MSASSLLLNTLEDPLKVVLEIQATNTEKISLPPNIIEDIISEVIIEMIFGRHFPTPFIASAERTGVAIFNGELSFARNRLLEEIGSAQKDVNPVELLSKSYNDYAWPVKANVDLARKFASITKKDSFIAQEHAMILDKFTDIVGVNISLG